MALKKSWPVFLFTAVLIASALSAKDEVPTGAEILSKSKQALGGENKFRRLENIRYDFMETQQTPGGPVTVSGRHYFKMDAPLGFRARVETSSPQGQTLTVFNSSGVWHWDNGREVKDSELLALIKEDILQKAFWLAAPFHLSSGTAALDYAGLGYIEGKLDRRVHVRLTPSYPLPQLASFTLYFDTSTHQLDGASFPSPDGRKLTLLLDRYAGTSAIGVPTRRVLMDDEHNVVAHFTAMRPEINNYIDEALMRLEAPKSEPPSTATTPATSAPAPQPR